MTSPWSRSASERAGARASVVFGRPATYNAEVIGILLALSRAPFYDMPPRQLTVAIVVGWLASSGWLFHRELWPNLRPGEPPPYTIDLADEAQRHDIPIAIRWAILRGGQPIGQLHTTVK